MTTDPIEAAALAQGKLIAEDCVRRGRSFGTRTPAQVLRSLNVVTGGSWPRSPSTG